MAKILIIDDDLLVCQSLSLVAERKGHETACANNLKTGIEKAVAEQFDVIFLDPPFEGDLLACALVLCLPLVNASGAVYVEASLPLARLAENQPEDVALRGGTLFPSLSDWQVSREGRAGAVHYHLLRRKNEE